MKAKKAKGFDCVAMKRELQAQLAAETAGMTWDEKVAYYHKKAMTGSLAAFWREVDAKGTADAPASPTPAKPKHRRRASPRRRSR
jgi:hypothetical protein